MKFKKSGQVLLALAVSLGLVLGMTACGASNTVDYLYVTSSKNNPGQIIVYLVDSESGALTLLKESPYPSGGRNPVAEVTSVDEKTLYVVNHDDNTLVQFTIGSDGKLYAQNTYNTPGTFPQAVAVTSSYLYVVDTYQPGFNDLNPGPGALAVYPINKDGSLGSPIVNGNLSYYPVCFTPTGVNVLASGSAVYVTNGGGCGSKPGSANGTISGFTVGASGALSAVAGSPFAAGVTPSAIASDPTSNFVYVTDSASNQLINYSVSSNGVLNPQVNGPKSTDIKPVAVTVDPRGQYVYVANFTANTVSAFSIDRATGNPTAIVGSGSSTGTEATGTGPLGIIVEPSLGRYVYTPNFLDNTVSGMKLDPNTGSLIQAINSPYNAASGQPTAVAAVTHNNHSLQHVQ